jgi:hypothetical protein
LAISSLITAGVCEGIIRFADGNSRPMIRLFEQDGVAGQIRLQPNGSARIGSPHGEPWEIHTDEEGHRLSSQAVSDLSWIVVGDSQVMGSGVDDPFPFPALMQLDGLGVHNLGVPGYGVGDALWAATTHLDKYEAQGVVIIINQMNDWEEVEAPVGARYTVRGGWLLDAEDAATARGTFLGSPLSRSHLGFLLGHTLLKDWNPPDLPPPAWMTDPVSMRPRTLRIAQAIVDFVAAHPTTRVLPVFLPADLYATEDRTVASPLSGHTDALSQPPWDDHRLRDQVMASLAVLEPLDLSIVLTKGEHFLTGDYHLSKSGHKVVAAAITASVEQAPSTPEAGSPEPETPPQP